MNDKIFWVWNGWGLLFTSVIVLLMFLYILLTEKIKIERTIPRNLFALIDLVMIILSFIFSGWIVGLLAFPLGMIGGVILAWLLIPLAWFLMPPKHFLKHYIPFVGIGLAIWGLCTLDWLQVAIGIVLWLIFPILHCFQTARIRKDNEQWLMYYTAGEAYRSLRKVFRKSPSYRNWIAVFNFAACEKVREEHNINVQKLSEVAMHLLSVEFSKEERQKVIDYYLHGDKSSDFHRAVIRAKEFLQGGSSTILHEVKTMILNIPDIPME